MPKEIIYYLYLVTNSILFNDELGTYNIASNDKTICFIKKNKIKNQLIIKFLTDNSLKIINISTPITNNAKIEAVRSNNQFILFSGTDSFLINDDSTFIKTSERKIYYKNKIVIKKTGIYKFELIYNSI